MTTIPELLNGMIGAMFAGKEGRERWKQEFDTTQASSAAWPPSKRCSSASIARGKRPADRGRLAGRRAGGGRHGSGLMPSAK